jgi:hypothetical protein
VKDAIQDSPVENDEADDSHEVDEENVGSVNGVLPILGPNGSIGADQDRRIRRIFDSQVANMSLEGQGNWMPAKVIKQEDCDFSHGNPKDEEPTNGRGDDQGWRNEAVKGD